MTAVCAFNAHSSSTMCVFNAHDISVRLSHYTDMDVEWFKSRKKARGLTDATLADAVGVERSVMNRWMNGKVGLDAYRADKLGEQLDASPEEILFRAGVPITDPALASNANVLTAVFALLLDTVGVDPFEDERARKIARQFPGALRRAAIRPEDPGASEETAVGESPHDPGEGRSEA